MQNDITKSNAAFDKAISDTMSAAKSRDSRAEKQRTAALKTETKELSNQAKEEAKKKRRTGNERKP